MTFTLVEAARDRSAVGRRNLATLAAALVGSGLLVSQSSARCRSHRRAADGSGIGQRLVIPSDARGHCYVAARVNGALFGSLMLDSGASGHITFGRNHATQLGFDPAKLSSPQVLGQRCRPLRERPGTGISPRSSVMRDVPANITDAPQSQPLIGTAVLHHLNFRLKDGNCELSWS